MNQINSVLIAALVASAGTAGMEAFPRALSTVPVVNTLALADTAASTDSGAVSATSIAPAVALSASLSSRILTVRAGDSVAATYMVSVGAEGHPTPTGTFTIRKIVWNPRWVPPRMPWARGKTAKEPGDPENPMRTVKLFFKEPDYYIHGTPAVESLGAAASKGCLRMDPEEVALLARWVMEHGGQPRPPSWFQRIRQFATREHVVYLGNPIPLTIDP